jgi:predicted amidohydrolase YtcJ
VKKINLILGFGYDKAQLAELRHPTRDDLDAVSTEYPIVLVHQSAQLATMNSKHWRRPA